MRLIVGLITIAFLVFIDGRELEAKGLTIKLKQLTQIILYQRKKNSIKLKQLTQIILFCMISKKKTATYTNNSSV